VKDKEKFIIQASKQTKIRNNIIAEQKPRPIWNENQDRVR